MQCMWFELECGRSFYRQQEYGKALKKFTAIDKHFTDWIDDQFDFHTYCLRKMTVSFEPGWKIAAEPLFRWLFVEPPGLAIAAAGVR